MLLPFVVGTLSLLAGIAGGVRNPELTSYENRLTLLRAPKPLLADHPEFVERVQEATRFEAPVLVDDRDADLQVRAWRFDRAFTLMVRPPSAPMRNEEAGGSPSE